MEATNRLTPLVSVIVPLHRPGDSLSRCLTSLQRQSLRETEFLFVVDGQGDEEAQRLLAEAAKQDPRIRILTNEKNLGAGPSRNRGIEAATGEYLAFVDADDYLSDDFLKILYARARLHALDIVKGSYANVRENGTIIRVDKEELQRIREGLAEGAPLYTLHRRSHLSALYRRDFVAERGLFYDEARHGQDTTFLLAATLAAERFGLEEKAVYYYVDRADSAVHRFSAERFTEDLKSLRKKIEILEKHACRDEYAAAYLYRHILWNLQLANHARGMETLQREADDHVAAVRAAVQASFLREALEEAYPVVRVLLREGENLCPEPYPTPISEGLHRREIGEILRRREDYLRTHGEDSLPGMEEIYKVSVIVPVYHAGKKLPACLASLQEQTLWEAEFLFVLDGASEEGEEEFLLQAAKEDPRIVVLKNEENQGPGPARNRGIREAKGEYLAFVDADDRVSRRFLEKLYERAKETQADIVKGTTVLCWESGPGEPEKIRILYSVLRKERAWKEGGHLYCQLAGECTSCLYRRAFLLQQDIAFDSCRFGEDTTFLLKATHRAKSFAAARDAFYLHEANYGTEARDAAWARKYDSREAIFALREKLRYLLAEVEDDAYRTQYARMRIAWALSLLKVWEHHGADKKILAQRLEEIRREVEKLPFAKELREQRKDIRALLDDGENLALGPILFSGERFDGIRKDVISAWRAYAGNHPAYQKQAIAVRAQAALPAQNTSLRPAVSVIVLPCHCAEKLSRALSCLQNQTLWEAEFLVLEDGTEEERIKELLRRAAADDPRIRILTDVGQKQEAAARNIAVEAAQGEYLTVFKAGDHVSREYLQRFYEGAGKEKADIVRGTMALYREDVPEGTGEIAVSYVLPGEKAAGRSEEKDAAPKARGPLLFRREFLLRHGVVLNKTLQEDEEFLRQAFREAGSIAVAEDAYYRRSAKDHKEEQALRQTGEYSGAPLVSVIVPVYRPGRKIFRCVLSLLHQTLREVEYLFIEDGGDDETAQIRLRQAARDDPRVRILVNEKNLGPGPSRNRGIEAARGKYLAFVDADDYLGWHFLEYLVKKAEKEGCDLVRGSFVRQYEGDLPLPERRVEYDGQSITNRLEKGVPPYAVFTEFFHAAVYRRDVICQSGARFGESRVGEDTTFLLRLCHKITRPAVMEKALYYYCQDRKEGASKAYLQGEEEVLSLQEKLRFLASDVEEDGYRVEYALGRVERALARLKLWEQGGADRARLARSLETVRREVAQLPFADEMRRKDPGIRALLDDGVNLGLGPYRFADKEFQGLAREVANAWADYAKEHPAYRVTALGMKSGALSTKDASDQKAPAVSVIVPVYRPGEGFARCLTSLRKQTLWEIEILLVVDGEATKEEDALLTQAAMDDPRIVILRNEKNLGAGPSRNRGIEVARGKYLSFVDADDSVSENFLETLYERAKKNNVDIVKGRRMYLEEGKPESAARKALFQDKTIAEGIKKGKSLFCLFRAEHTTALYRRDLVLASGARYGEGAVQQDDIFLLRVTLAAKSFAQVDQGARYYVSIRPGSATGRVDAWRCEGMLRSLGDKLALLETLPQPNDDVVKAANIDIELLLRLQLHLEALGEEAELSAWFLSKIRETVRRSALAERLAAGNTITRALLDHEINLCPLPYGFEWEEPDPRDFAMILSSWETFFDRYPEETTNRGAIISQLTRIENALWKAASHGVGEGGLETLSARLMILLQRIAQTGL